uniref:Nucleotide exchange factor Fes1 domain-containing protein n=1 Tax=Timema poppense TaxID=170557 RepID=A0A7R9DN73_TIMPO|nr:unnamed protein product [Timema poppensis]
MSSDSGRIGEGDNLSTNNMGFLPAIEYQAGNVTIAENQPRQPQSLQDLLRFTVEASSMGQEPATSPLVGPMDEDRRQFLEQTLRSMTVDIVEVLSKAIEVLKRASSLSSEDDPTECEEAFQEIMDHVDNIDNANDFHKIGGFCIFTPCLNSVHSGLRWRAADLLAELAQNNPYCQQKVLEAKLMPVLISLLNSDPNEQVRIKSLYALSTLIRECNEALEEFRQNDGFSALLKALQSGVDKLKIKASFLISSLNQAWVKNELHRLGFVRVFVNLISEEVNPCTEHLLSALLNLVASHEASQVECRGTKLELRETLSRLIEGQGPKEEFREVCEYARQLSLILFDGDEVDK